jgi:hypothetical protein
MTEGAAIAVGRRRHVISAVAVPSGSDMSNPPILVTDRIKQVLQDHGVTREMIERRVAEHRPRGRRLSVDLNALTFQPGVVAAMLELVTEPRDASSSAASLWPFRPTY